MSIESLLRDEPARAVLTEMFRGWSEDLTELFAAAKWPELRASLRGLALMMETLAAAENALAA